MKKTLLVFCLVFLTALFFPAGKALASTVTLTPSADTYIDEVIPNANMGNASTIRVIYEQYLSQGIKAAFGAVKFDLASIPSDATISSAKLRLYSTACTPSSGTSYITMSVSKITSANWNETTLNWNNKPTYLPFTSSQISGTGYKEWTLTTLVKNWKSGAAPNYGVYILSGTNTFNCTFNSKEASSNKPQLVVTYSVPLHLVPIQPVIILDVTKPVISHITESNINPTQTTIAWTTNESADSHVDYYRSGHASSVGIVGNSILTTNHSVNLAPLLSGTTYYYRIRSKDASGNEASTNYTAFTTSQDQGLQVVTFPVISNVSHTTITQTSAKITWTTDQQASSYVSYGTTQSDATLVTTGNENAVTNHSISVSGLSPNTTYYYKVKSTNAFGSTTITPTFKNFTTLNIADTTPAVLSNINAVNVMTNSATITWNTNEISTSWVFFSKNANDSTPISEYEGHFGQNDGVFSHLVNLTDLDPNTTYSYRVVSLDTSANWATSNRKTFTTGATAIDATPSPSTPPPSAPLDTPPTPPSTPPIGGTTEQNPITPPTTPFSFQTAVKSILSEAKNPTTAPSSKTLLLLGAFAVLIIAIVIVIVSRHVLLQPKVIVGAVLIALVIATPFAFRKLKPENDRSLEQAIRENTSLVNLLEAKVAGASTSR